MNKHVVYQTSNKPECKQVRNQPTVKDRLLAPTNLSLSTETNLCNQDTNLENLKLSQVYLWRAARIILC